MNEIRSIELNNPKSKKKKKIIHKVFKKYIFTQRTVIYIQNHTPKYTPLGTFVTQCGSCLLSTKKYKIPVRIFNSKEQRLPKGYPFISHTLFLPQ
jgi:hypothetical protein